MYISCEIGLGLTVEEYLIEFYIRCVLKIQNNYEEL